MDHREAGPGKQDLFIKWQDGARTWEPLVQIYRDVPQLVQTYFESQGINIQRVLEGLANSGSRYGFSNRGGRGSFRGRGRGGNSSDNNFSRN